MGELLMWDMGGCVIWEGGGGIGGDFMREEVMLV